MDAIKLLKKDHSSVLSLFNKFDQAGRNAFMKKFKLYDEIRFELDVHSHAEEEIFYAVIREKSAEGRKLVSEAIKEHRDFNVLVGQIDRLSADDPNFEDRVQALMEQVEHHIEEEERDFFKFVEENCSQQELLDMGRKIEALKVTYERRAA